MYEAITTDRRLAGRRALIAIVAIPIVAAIAGIDDVVAAGLVALAIGRAAIAIDVVVAAQLRDLVLAIAVAAVVIIGIAVVALLADIGVDKEITADGWTPGIGPNAAVPIGGAVGWRACARGEKTGEK